MNISLSDSFAILIAVIPIFLLLLWISLFLLFLLVDYCKLYLYTSLFDSLYFLICGCSPQHRYDLERAMYQRQLKIDKSLKFDKAVLEGTLRILLFSDVDIYTPTSTTTDLGQSIGENEKQSVENIKNLSQSHSNMKYSSQTLFNSLKLKYGPEFSNTERKYYADCLPVHVLLLFQNVFIQILKSKSNFEKGSSIRIAEKLMKTSAIELWQTENKIAVKDLIPVWNDSVFQKYYLLEKQKGMSDCLDYIFHRDQLYRISQHEFLPSNEDIEKMNIVLPLDHSLKTNTPVMKVVININEKRKIKITQFSMKFFKMKYKLGSSISDNCDFAIFIGRRQNDSFLIRNSKTINIFEGDDKNVAKIICLDEHLLSTDKFHAFMNCFANLNLRKGIKYFKHDVTRKIASLPSAIFNTI